MRVRALTSAVITIDGAPISLPPDREVELPDDRAKALIKAGICIAVSAPKEKAPKEPRRGRSTPAPAPAAKGAPPADKE